MMDLSSCWRKLMDILLTNDGFLLILQVNSAYFALFLTAVAGAF